MFCFVRARVSLDQTLNKTSTKQERKRGRKDERKRGREEERNIGREVAFTKHMPAAYFWLRENASPGACGLVRDAVRADVAGPSRPIQEHP